MTQQIAKMIDRSSIPGCSVSLRGSPTAGLGFSFSAQCNHGRNKPSLTPKLSDVKCHHDAVTQMPATHTRLWLHVWHGVGIEQELWPLY